MKAFRRIIALVICAVTMMNFSLVSFADNEGVIFNYSYTVTDDGFKDSFNVRNDDGTVSTINRTVLPSGQSTVILHSPMGERKYTGRVNYDMLISSATGMTGSTRVNVHDSNIFNHTLISRNSVTVTREEGEFARDVMVAILSSGLSISNGGLSAVVNFMWNRANDPDCAYIVCDESIYEVIFRADGVYYTHCFHENVIAYRSNGSVLPNGSYNLTYERTGG